MPTATAKVFKNGNSQAVRLPKEFRFTSSEVYIRKVNGNVILSEKKPSWDDFFDMPTVFGDDFLADRINQPPQIRKFFDDNA